MVSIIEKRENIVIVGHLLANKKDNNNEHKNYTLTPKDPRLPKILVSSKDWHQPIILKPGTRESKDIYYGTISSDTWYGYKTPIGYVCALLCTI